jgi:signal transduction histidine kinase
VTAGSRRTMALVGAAVALLVGGVAWISVTAVRAARQEAEARDRAAVEEAVRLALWRMDSFVAPLLARAQLVAMGHAGELGPFVRVARAADAPDPAVRQALAESAKSRPKMALVKSKVAVAPERYQSERSSMELFARSKNVDMQMKSSLGVPADVPLELLRPVWLAGELLLVRAGADGVRAFSARIDWPALRRRLKDEIADLLPGADLVAAKENDERRLASLPVRLEPGALAAPAPEGGFPLFLGLGLAWASVLLAVVAVAALLVGAVALSERRAVFVSAVTHELRTPLTTFRTYTEMLARGMVPEASRAEYLETLRHEADRLAHLTENVLMYSRLERGRDGHRAEVVELGALAERLRPRLDGRVAEAGMTLSWPEAEARVQGDATAIEQILFNLVDNACKYAASATDRRITIDARVAAGQVVVDVRDRGPGVPASDRRRLFQPFSRSARDAAGHAPGVGLGLALSRRLARAMRGDLALVDGAEGACFRLTLPAAQ